MLIIAVAFVWIMQIEKLLDEQIFYLFYGAKIFKSPAL
jgi:hypothetical protein